MEIEYPMLIAVSTTRDVSPPQQVQTSAGAATSAAVPSANDLDTMEIDEEMDTIAKPNGISVS